ncbi:hypothetical protein [Jannaschia donghaensis]|nr:hypothetical protein [Jannaschia donghaensis]
MAWISVAALETESQAKFDANPITAMPMVGSFDPATDPPVAVFVTQNSFEGWEVPVSPVPISGGAGDLLTLRNPALSGFTLGAPVATVEKGLIGVVVRAADGAAQVAGLSTVVDAAVSEGIPVLSTMQSLSVEDGGLPPRIESEMGRVVVFADWGSLGWIGGYYGPSMGGGFDETFVATIEFSTWNIASDGQATFYAGSDKTLPLIPAGQSLAATRGGPTSDHMATCIVHATPSSAGRRALVVQLWRLMPHLGTSQSGGRHFEDASVVVTDWADGDTACADALGTLDEARLAVLFGQAPPAPQEAAKEAEEATAMQVEAVSKVLPSEGQGNSASTATWQELPLWEATGLAAVQIPLGERSLIVGCTESRELAVALILAEGEVLFTIAGIPAQESGMNQGTAYGLFAAGSKDRLIRGALEWDDEGGPQKIAGPPESALIGEC